MHGISTAHKRSAGGLGPGLGHEIRWGMAQGFEGLRQGLEQDFFSSMCQLIIPKQRFEWPPPSLLEFSGMPRSPLRQEDEFPPPARQVRMNNCMKSRLHLRSKSLLIEPRYGAYVSKKGFQHSPRRSRMLKGCGLLSLTLDRELRTHATITCLLEGSSGRQRPWAESF